MEPKSSVFVDWPPFLWLNSVANYLMEKYSDPNLNSHFQKYFWGWNFQQIWNFASQNRWKLIKIKIALDGSSEFVRKIDLKIMARLFKLGTLYWKTVNCSQIFHPLDSSVGRAEDCSRKMQTSLGHWFESGSRDIFSLFFTKILSLNTKYTENT